jgi:pSer/pThr/pTyr-binding forkhead associated (FHA) protein
MVMPVMVPVLIGTAGMVEGECFVLGEGVEVTIGRSRSCDISLRKTSAYLKTPSQVRDNDHDFNTVSRRHIRIQVKDGQAAIQDLSSNGTYCNGEQLVQPRKVDLKAAACSIRLGTRETFDLALMPNDDPRVQGLQPITGAPAAQQD